MVVLTSFPPPSEGIRHEQPNTSALVENKDLGTGTLYIAESRVSWVSEEGQGFSLEYPAISLHAISRDVNAFPKECLYLMIDAKLDDPTEKDPSDNSNEDDDDDDDGEDVSPVTEIRFIPQDNSNLDAMYQTMSQCQTLHPDPNDSVSEEDEEEDNFEDAEEDDTQMLQSAAHIGGGDSVINQLPVPDILGGGQAIGVNNDEPMDVSQFEDAEPEH